MIEASAGAWEAVMNGTLPDVGNWSYLIIFVMVFIEGPIVTLIAGAMVGAGLLRLDLAYAACAIGNFAADQFWYWLGYVGGHRGFLYRIGWVRRRRRQIEEFEIGMQDHGIKLYLLSKVSMGLFTIPILIAAGIARVNWLRLTAVNLAFEIVWTAFLLFAGLRLGEHIAQMERSLQVAAVVGGVVFLFLAITLYRSAFQRIMQAGRATVP
jgi:membrane protein DedA with SNARE-associated domain